MRFKQLIPTISVFLMFSFVSTVIASSEDFTEDLPLNAHLSEAYHDDLDGLLQRRYIRVLTTLNQTNFFIFQGKMFGFEYALLKGYEKYLNKNIPRREMQVVLEFIPVSRDRLIPLLVDGYGDIAAAGLTITPEREKQVAFTRPYLTGVNEVVVTHKGGFTPQNVFDLSGKKVFVRKSSSYFQSLVALNEALRKQWKRKVKIIPADEDLETESLLEMVNSGALETTVADSHIAGIWSDLLPDIEVHEAVKLRTNSKIAWMVRKENPQLRDSLNRFLKTHKKGTLLGNIYFKRYFEDNRWLKNPADPADLKQMKKYKTLVQKYAEQYGYDWKLIMALAFQESGLDHTKKSPAGAMGLLQVLPATAKDQRINIQNVQKLENNIHAGIKYLSLLQNEYFNDTDIRPRDRIRFALASYNAGPAKIQQARRLTEKMGLNSNRWFRNVEIAVLRLIGQETVRYVSNINKYYNVYNLILEEK
ncbi:MAG: transporter substrate-binding domain-containing protein [Deltaproteobacteria bacterium]|nr:transporter substrate-binding domain-containing protein [Deltaproteobacteria bacterium]